MDAQEFFFQFYIDLPRQGPGDNQSTTKAFNSIPHIKEIKSLLDIGCGTGMQTIQLAKLMDGRITAVDFYKPYLDKLELTAKKEKLQEKISTSVQLMEDLEFDDNSFDIIWSEGSIYIIGLEKGLNEWKRFLKPNGYLVCSHICWLKKDIPEELKECWKIAYPEITDVDSNIDIIVRNGYKVINHFTLPESSWWDNYYNPLLKKLESLDKKYINDPGLSPIIKEAADEIKLFRKYSAYYGYEFFIVQKS